VNSWGLKNCTWSLTLWPIKSVHHRTEQINLLLWWQFIRLYLLPDLKHKIVKLLYFRGGMSPSSGRDILINLYKHYFYLKGCLYSNDKTKKENKNWSVNASDAMQLATPDKSDVQDCFHFFRM
jgi:hypothetical protein